MLYKFIDNLGTFLVKNPHNYNAYFPLTNASGSLLSAISPYLSGDIKKDNEHFLTIPTSILDLKNNLLCRREFFLKIDNSLHRLSQPAKFDQLEAGLLYHKITKKINSANIEILNFIPYNLNAEVMTITIENKGKKAITLYPTSFIPLYGRSEKNLRDHRHVSSLLNRIELNKYGLTLKPTMIFDETGHKINNTLYYALGFQDNLTAFKGQFPTLEEFLGNGDINNPQAISQNLNPLENKQPNYDGKEVCASFKFLDKVLKPGQKTTYAIILGIADNSKAVSQTFAKLNSLKKINLALQETKNYWVNYLKTVEFNFPDSDYNNWLIWVKLQPSLRKLFGCSFLPHFDYGKGGRGWRDLWQDALTLLITEPDKAKELIINNFKGVRLDGSNATIITKDGFISDRNKINRVWMDHGVWPYLTLRLYLNRTGNLNLLLKDITYFRDHQIKRAKATDKQFQQNDYLLRDSNGKVYTGSILEHILIQNLVQFFNVGQHNIIKLENADWNDGLDMAQDKGESVTFSFMYAHNLYDLINFLKQLKKSQNQISLLKELTLLLDRTNQPINYANYKEKQKRLDLYFNQITTIKGIKVLVNIDSLINDLEEKAKHLNTWLNKQEWLKLGFFNGYYDNKGKRVEGKFANSIRMRLESQVFAIMSGVATTQQIEKIWDSIKKYLYDNKLGGFHLNTNFNSLYTDFGRAFGFAYGEKENGAFFNHMIIMLANALYKRGFIKQGSQVINSLYSMASNNLASIYPSIPEYFNNQGQGLYLYLTGSASWYTYTLIEEIIGIKFRLGDILIEPKLTSDNLKNNRLAVAINIGKNNLKINFIAKNKKDNVIYKIKKVIFNNSRYLAPYNQTNCLIKKEWLKPLTQVTILLD